MLEEEKRWEFCVQCGDGFSKFLGPKNGYNEFECTVPDCEAFFRVEIGKGNYDKRLGMQLSDKVIYWDTCDGCHKHKPVKLFDMRFMCHSCQR